MCVTDCMVDMVSTDLPSVSVRACYYGKLVVFRIVSGAS